MTLRPAAVCSLAVLALSPLAALAQKNTFEIFVADKKVGKDVFSLDKDKHGYKLASRLTFRMDGSDGDYTAEYKFDENYAYQSVTINNNSNLSSSSYIANKAQTELAIGTVQGPLHDSNAIPITPNFVFLPPFDPGAAQAILTLATTHPSKGDAYTVFTPSVGGGGGGGRGGRRGGSAPAASADDTSGAGVEESGVPHDARWFKGKPSGGTLEGQPVLLDTYLLAFGRSRYIFYADQTGRLMELRIPGMKSEYVRVGFKLNTTPAPAAPPAQ